MITTIERRSSGKYVACEIDKGALKIRTIISRTSGCCLERWSEFKRGGRSLPPPSTPVILFRNNPLRRAGSVICFSNNPLDPVSVITHLITVSVITPTLYPRDPVITGR